MARAALIAPSLAVLAALFACGGQTSPGGTSAAGGTGNGAGGAAIGAGGATAGGGGASTAGSSTAGGGGATVVKKGDCVTDADCPGGTCVPVAPGGYLVCAKKAPPATGCFGGPPGLDQCCTTVDCKEGVCLTTPLTPYCGGPAMATYNICATDTCKSDAECGSGICVAPGVLGNKVRACIAAGCHVSADCGEEPGGACIPVTAPCCGQPTALACVYPKDGCSSSADCPVGQGCVISGKRARCQPGDQACPV